LTCIQAPLTARASSEIATLKDFQRLTVAIDHVCLKPTLSLSKTSGYNIIHFLRYF